MVRVLVEQGKKRAFASALDWPGWARGGKTEAEALAALEAYRPRYAAVARKAGLEPPAEGLEVVERLPGDATTDYGVPAQVAAADREPLAAPEAERRARLVEAAWAVLGEVAAGAPAELRKGPRGGGRDRDAIVAHVRDAEPAYARRMGLSGRGGRQEIAGGLRDGSEGRWPTRYGARRVAWHALDHAWEIEDRVPG